MSGDQRARRQQSDRPDGAALESEPDLDHALHRVQQAVGNQATATLMDQSLVAQARLEVGTTDDPAERAADLVAAQLMAGIDPAGGSTAGGAVDDAEAPVARRSGGGGADPLGGMPVAAELEDAIESARGGGSAVPADLRRSFQPGLGVDLGQVRLHTDSRADELSRSLQAEAFTTGRDVFFRKGAYDPRSPGGQELIAHELAHVEQQGGAVKRRLHRRLDPSTQVIFEGMAAKANGGKDAKGFLFVTPTYKKIKSDLAEYIDKQADKDAKWKAAKLQAIDKNIANWLGDKKHAADTSENGTNRREAMLWLVTRVQAEYMMVAKLDEKQQSGGGSSDKGGMNTVEVGVGVKKGVGLSKNNKGVFKAPASGYGVADAPAADEAAIPKKDSKFTERAIASSAVAKLMGSDVVAETVAAERNGQSGYMMEMASGVQPRGEKKIRPTNDTERDAWASAHEMGDETFGMDEEGPYKTKVVVNQVNWSDPRLQEQLVELQLLDAITGQVDRHASNYFVDQGEGKETKVKGIDPDLSFGKGALGTEKMDDAIWKDRKSSADKTMDELPPICKASTARRILGMTERDLKQLLGGTLDAEEVQAAVKRLQRVQAHIKQLQKDRCVFESFEEEDENFRLARFTEKNSYIGRDRYWQYRERSSGRG
jgi:hypothetical protein